MYDQGPTCLVRSQSSFLKLSKRRRENDRRAVKDEDVISGHVKHRGREETGRPSGLIYQTQLSIKRGFHYHGNTSMKGHLGASRFPAAFLQKSHPQRGTIFHPKAGNALLTSELINDKVLTFAHKIVFSRLSARR